MRASVFDARPCDLGEGPLWHPERGQLFWFDINGKRLMTRGQDWAFDRHASAAGWVGRDALLVATETDLLLVNVESGTQQHVAPLEADNPGTRSNDGRADPWGGFWIGTMGKGAEPGAGAIYRYFRGDVRRLFDGITITNAICFAPDGGYAHFADTKRGTVWRQRLSDKDGWPLGEPEVFLDHGPDGPNPDGAVVDSDGNFWCAEWGSSRVRAYARDGSVHRDVGLPVSQPSCPAFGGPELRDLYVTTARESLTETDLAREPLAGQVFVATETAQGQREHEVIL
ncbi:SMP-30/gluconolactonase/LRE family protein [Nioella nitratireducens]|uniref:SMP-30/gluconolactonase/LRE family protein n=1 Tax=Nioella nitratireducens TaxID=1287720 RepID=UPI0008FD6796|nr:SMP-30/gluconolactonase/LRE family protein [Nioella nitratireducens]